MGRKVPAWISLLSDSQFSRRSVLKGLTLSIGLSWFGTEAFGATGSAINAIVGRPTANSFAISLLSGTSANAYIEYGYKPTALTKKTNISKLVALSPVIVELSNLQANSIVYFRIRSKANAGTVFATGETNSVTLQRKVGSNFSFVVQGDSHPERVGKMFNADLYTQTLGNIAKQKPDFMVMLGDDFSIDPLIEKNSANQVNVEKVYSTQRNWLSAVAKSIPIFLVNGNHEQAAAYLLNGSNSSPAVLAGNARIKYFPLPDVSGFYSSEGLEIISLGVGEMPSSSPLILIGIQRIPWTISPG